MNIEAFTGRAQARHTPKHVRVIPPKQWSIFTTLHQITPYLLISVREQESSRNFLPDMEMHYSLLNRMQICLSN